MFNPKRKYFKEMLKDAERVIYDAEFKKFVALQERETIRRQYDQANDALARVTAALEGSPKNEELQNEQKLITDRITNLKKEMDAVDGTIVGSAPSEMLPEGAKGLDNILSQWVQRREYIKSFIELNT